jgi:hypothetical protein
LRRNLPLLRQAAYRHGDIATATGRADIEWFDASGVPIASELWSAIACFGVLLSRPDGSATSGAPGGAPGGSAGGAAGVGGELAVAILFNAGEQACEISLPAIAAAGCWSCRYSSAAKDGYAAGDVAGAGRFRAAEFSIACLTYAGA